MKNRLIRYGAACGLVLIFAGASVGEERDRPAGQERDGVSDRREQFRNASPEERRRMMMEKRREREGQSNHDKRDSRDREGRPGLEGRQPPSGDMHNRMLYHLISNPERAAKIGVSDEQARAIKQQLEDNEQNMRKAQEEMRALFRRQAELMSAETINEEELMAVVEEAGARHTALAKMRIQQLLIVKNALTPEQIAKLKEMFQEKRRRMADHMRERSGEGQRPEPRKQRPERPDKRPDKRPDQPRQPDRL